MGIKNLLILFLLAAIWGASFLFMRISAPIFGPITLIEYRVASAALALLLFSFLLNKKLQLTKYGVHYLKLGFINTALPFLLFAYAAQTLSASLLSVLNASSPIWGAVVAKIWYKKPLSLMQTFGMFLGVLGVAILVGFDQNALVNSNLAIFATLMASFCYGIGSNYSQTRKEVEPYANAHGSLWAATIIILPLMLAFPHVQQPTTPIWMSVIALGVLCTAFAYILYFKLIVEVGAQSALTVTFLIPVFGVLWGRVFLHELLNWQMILGALIVVLGTAFVTQALPLRRFK
ncbi:MAG: EamA family transporter [Gammaproteobacteria bacterium CG22_combo_CG10-13_8_21_14_all_40_8]|nr:MAG: EamA family transporter [Gammaproteobacteria bacterium CG22_combo_CG10-13_8_21_14_all_40_8]